MKRLLITACSLVLFASVPMIASANGATATGTWYSYPDQTYTDVPNVVSTDTAFKSAVRAPINADGSSNWPQKRGVIPVQFDLLSATATTTSTVRTYDPPVWESVNGAANSWSYAGINLDTGIAIKDVSVSAIYDFTEGDCYGGSLRWTLRVNVDGTNQLLHVYYGTPNGPDQGCSGANSGSGQDLMDVGITDYRFEMPGGWGVPGPVYTTWADVLASTHDGTDLVNRAQLTLDSGWSATQRADVSAVTVNGNVWVPKTTQDLGSNTVYGDFARTCDLPPAELRWAKNDGTPSGGVNEDQSIQPKDTGQFYRQVDCKYIYNLDVSTLAGPGTYTVWVWIDPEVIQTPATFDLR